MSGNYSQQGANQQFLNTDALEPELTLDPWEDAGVGTEEHRENWLLSYVDILTLLLALFILLLALQPKGETQAVAETTAITKSQEIEPPPVEQPPVVAINFGTLETLMTIQPSEAIIPPQVQQFEPIINEYKAAPVNTPIAEASQQQPATTVEQETPAAPSTEPNPITNDFIAALKASGLDDRIEVTKRRENVHLEVQDSILFAPAETEFKEQGKQLLSELAQLFQNQEGLISIQGHTDNRPIANARFPSNWELSTGRASVVARYLIGHGIAAERLQAVGYADTKPISDNQTAEGRARNRRVSLVVDLSSVPEKPK